MNAGIGVWIDSRTAVIAAAGTDAAGKAVVLRRITTDLEKQLRLSGGERAKTSRGPQRAPPDDMRETSSKTNLRHFFDKVAAALRGARSVFIFGPGEVKGEFKKRLEKAGFGGRMSDRQISAKVRSHYRRPP